MHFKVNEKYKHTYFDISFLANHLTIIFYFNYRKYLITSITTYVYLIKTHTNHFDDSNQDEIKLCVRKTSSVIVTG